MASIGKVPKINKILVYGSDAATAAFFKELERRPAEAKRGITSRQYFIGNNKYYGRFSFVNPTLHRSDDEYAASISESPAKIEDADEVLIVVLDDDSEIRVAKNGYFEAKDKNKNISFLLLPPADEVTESRIRAEVSRLGATLNPESFLSFEAICPKSASKETLEDATPPLRGEAIDIPTVASRSSSTSFLTTVMSGVSALLLRGNNTPPIASTAENPPAPIKASIRKSPPPPSESALPVRPPIKLKAAELGHLSLGPTETAAISGDGSASSASISVSSSNAELVDYLFNTKVSDNDRINCINCIKEKVALDKDSVDLHAVNFALLAIIKEKTGETELKLEALRTLILFTQDYSARDREMLKVVADDCVEMLQHSSNMDFKHAANDLAVILDPATAPKPTNDSTATLDPALKRPTAEDIITRAIEQARNRNPFTEQRQTAILFGGVVAEKSAEEIAEKAIKQAKDNGSAERYKL